MSGRDPEPISAFFPSIDRNLMLDLDRHFRRTAAPVDAEPEETIDQAAEEAPQLRPTPQQHEGFAARPNTSDVLEAVEQAAAAMAAMDQRIHELEAKQVELESTNNQLRTKLGELLQLQQTSEAKARSENERATRAEESAAQHMSRADVLEGDLETALGDLTRIAEAINGSLGATYRR